MKGKTHQRVVDHFRIATTADWRLVRGSDVLTVSGVGKGYLKKLRLYLANRDVCLKGDNPPSYWLKTLNVDKDQAVSGICPFTIVVDTNETFPWAFDAIEDKKGNLIDVRTVRKPLYRSGLADYTIEGYETEIQLERKSLEDLVGTLSGRRESFEEEIARIDGLCSFAAIICESGWEQILQDQHTHGARAKSVSRTFLSWAIRYPNVHWIMCAGRQHAEIVAFQLLKKFWWQANGVDSVQEKRSTSLFRKV